MQWFGSSYSSHYNWSHNRKGPLFQGRFKAFQVEEEDYLKRLILYIHRNPIRAGMVKRLVDYPWSSFRCLGYKKNCNRWLHRDKTLKLFGGSEDRFREEVRRYSEEKDRLLEDLRIGLYLGGEETWEKIRNRLKFPVESEQPQTRGLLQAQSLESAANEYQKALDIDDITFEDLLIPRRRDSRPLRDILQYFLWKRTRKSLKEIGEFMGVNYSTVSHTRKRGEAYLKKRAYTKIRKKIEDLLN